MSTIKHERVGITKAAKIVDCSTVHIYRQFDGIDGYEEGTPIDIMGTQVARRQVDQSDPVRPNTKWVFDVWEEEAAPTSSEASRAVSLSIPASTTQEEFERLRTSLNEAQARLHEVSKQASDPDILHDDEMWSILNEDRRKALATINTNVAELGKAVLRSGGHVQWLTHEQQRKLKMVEGVDVDSMKKLLKSDEEVSSLEPIGGIELKPVKKRSSKRKPANRALIYGGDPRSDTIQRLEQTFGYDEVDWMPGDKNATSMIQRVENGYYTTVVGLLRLASHGAIEQLKAGCKKSGSLFVPVASGYGVSSIQRAIDHYTGHEFNPHGSGGA